MIGLESTEELPELPHNRSAKRIFKLVTYLTVFITLFHTKVSKNLLAESCTSMENREPSPHLYAFTANKKAWLQFISTLTHM